MAPFTTDHIPGLAGKTVIITGANSGIGHAAAQALGSAGAQIVLAVRDQAKGEAAAATIAGTTEVRPLDLASLDSVRAFAAASPGAATSTC
jgi:NAD(P)-dependent dehydrogenase (short-subunit alcohol dehydrogenase family)